MKWQQLKKNSIDEIIHWAESKSWCQAMAQCAQDNQWHAEGDVWTHTQLVMRQLPKLGFWGDATNEQKTILVFTALFHDVAKPKTSQMDEQTGHIVSPKHALKGEFLTRSILRDLSCDLTIREQICRMVRYHGRPVFLHEKEHPIHEIVRLSWFIENQLLYSFALADKRGRTTVVDGRTEENLHYWKLVAEESQCLNQPYSFANDHARFLFFNSKKPDLHYVPHEQFKSYVTIMSGLPGSGKDTWIQANRSEIPVVSLDEIRTEMKIAATDNQGAVAQTAKERCREFLRSGSPFVFNATNTIKQTRQRWIDLFASYHAHIEIVYLEPQLETVLARNLKRASSVPTSVIKKLASRCEPPTWTECHQLVCESN